MFRVLDQISWRGSEDRANEDACGTAGDWAWVIDTSIFPGTPSFMHPQSDAAWLAGFADNRFAALAAEAADADDLARIGAGYARMEAAARGADDHLDADIAFHIAVLQASGNPFYQQFRDVVSTALRTSIRFTNRKGHTASLPAHHAVLAAIQGRKPDRAHKAMRTIIADVMTMIDEAEAG